MTPELAAFREVDFDWARQLQSVWQDPPYNVEMLHGEVEADIFADFRRLFRSGAGSGIGRVVVGPAGSGKTHLVGNLRKRVWEAEGWFVLLDIVGITDFWRTAALGFINSLHQRMPNGRPQYENVLLRVLKSLPPAAVQAVSREAGGFQRGDTVALAQRFVGLLKAAHPGVAMQHRDVVRAFILLRDDATNNAAYSWLQGLDIEAEERKALGFESPPPAATELVRGMSWFMSLAGPTMIAADQLDAIVTAANLSAGSGPDTGDETEQKARAIIETLAGGLMDLRDVTARSLTVVTCLPETWNVLKSRALQAAVQRFVEPVPLRPPHDSAVVRRIIGDRVSAAYQEVGFQPLYSTWPFRPSAVESATGMAPRQVLMRCDAHRRRCIAAGAVSECESLEDAPPPPREREGEHGLDAEFRRRRDAAEIDGLLRADNESKALRELLADALALYVRQTETPEDVDLVVRRDPNEQKPTLHGRLVFAFRAEGEREQHFCFRVLDHSHAIAFQARLRAAMTASGIDAKLAFRHLFILRSGPPPSGPVTRKLVGEFQAAGGVFIRPQEDDLRALLALRGMERSGAEGFEAWLRATKPLDELALFKISGLSPSPLGPARRDDSEKAASRPEKETSAGEARSAEDRPVCVEAAAASAEAGDRREHPVRPARRHAKTAATAGHAAAQAAAEPPRAIPLGRRLEGGGEGRAEELRAELLPRHVAIIAGTGSGKTVLLRRIVEEAALLAIPAIVLDTNNDLARLGQPWPEPPPSFSAADAAKAARYAREVEVVVWTPGLPAGRPLSLSLLPDFRAVEEAGERDQAVQMALATLLPFVGATGQKGPLKEGVLADALREFARRGGAALPELIALLGELPEGVTAIGGAEKLAAEMADRLRAALATNPLLKPEAESLDPETLFAGAHGRTRISVINFSGLPADAARQAFVNQLQMALFTWIKRHPSPTGRLYVMDEAQNFAPSERSTPASESTRALAAQARKYGLGMIFATQVPKGIDNRIVSNCTTHFYGRQSAPATIQAAKEMMAARGGGGDDIGRLSGGQFYVSTEGMGRPARIKTPLCLSFHPQNPLGPEEVEQLARRNARR